jgi:hypothetical protein
MSIHNHSKHFIEIFKRGASKLWNSGLKGHFRKWYLLPIVNSTCWLTQWFQNKVRVFYLILFKDINLIFFFKLRHFNHASIRHEAFKNEICFLFQHLLSFMSRIWSHQNKHMFNNCHIQSFHSLGNDYIMYITSE